MNALSLCLLAGSLASTPPSAGDQAAPRVAAAPVVASAPITLEPSAPVDPAAILAVIQSAPEYFSAAIDIFELANRIARGGIWPLWYCKYADGTIVFNKFRFYRDGTDVTLYFTGRPGSHDCDAWYYDSAGRKVRFCTINALQFAVDHGRIVDIGLAE